MTSTHETNVGAAGAQTGASQQVEATVEKRVAAKSGWGMLALVVLGFLASVACFVAGAILDTRGWSGIFIGLTIIAGSVLIILACIATGGFMMVQPNTARVLTLFGEYKGTTTDTGLRWVNPFCKKTTVSLRARTLNGEHLKVNDKLGNPIEIANNLKNNGGYIPGFRPGRPTSQFIQKVIGKITLRSNITEVSEVLRRELASRLAMAGVAVDDARLTHLAYAPEIAQSMLRRQQADAIIAARGKIVRGAVDMVEMALGELSERHVVDMDEDRRAAMVSNLLVVLCGDSEAQPVVNTGTIYQ